MKANAAITIAFGLAPVLINAGCPATCSSNNLQLSCHNSSAVSDLCCFNSPGGELLQTQFWDYNPASGPSDSWTIHGLWPDNCDGSFQQFCDDSRNYTNITQILESYGQTQLLQYMQTYWKDEDGNDESFWEHEWGKHGTCISTLKPSCYSNYSPQEEVVDFFTRTVSLYKGLDTYTFLKNAGIVPSNGRNYTLKSVQSALSNAPGRNGTVPTIECDDAGAINQVYYYYNVRGSVQTGDFVASDADGEKSNCPDSVIYPPKKNGTQAHPTSVTASAAPTATLNGSCRLNSKWQSKHAARQLAS